MCTCACPPTPIAQMARQCEIFGEHAGQSGEKRGLETPWGWRWDGTGWGWEETLLGKPSWSLLALKSLSKVSVLLRQSWEVMV